jgi:hypothetical protein
MLVGTCHGYKILSTNARLADVLGNTVSSHGGYGDEAATKAIMMLLPLMLQKLRRPIRLLLMLLSETLRVCLVSCLSSSLASLRKLLAS